METLLQVCSVWLNDCCSVQGFTGLAATTLAATKVFDQAFCQAGALRVKALCCALRPLPGLPCKQLALRRWSPGVDGMVAITVTMLRRRSMAGRQ